MSWGWFDYVDSYGLTVIYARRSKSVPLLTVAYNNAVDDVIVAVATATITTIFSSDWLSLYTTDKTGWP